MKKILILIISLIGTLTLTGCDQSVGAQNFGCAGNTVSYACNGAVAYRATWKSTYGNFDADLVKINLNQSNVNLTATSGTIALSIKNTSGNVVASSVFDWYSVGNYIYPSSKSPMSAWINSNLQNGYEIGFDINGIETDGNIGINTLTTVFEYDGMTIGASESFYLNEADLNGF